MTPKPALTSSSMDSVRPLGVIWFPTFFESSTLGVGSPIVAFVFLAHPKWCSLGGLEILEVWNCSNEPELSHVPQIIPEQYFPLWQDPFFWKRTLPFGNRRRAVFWYLYTMASVTFFSSASPVASDSLPTCSVEPWVLVTLLLRCFIIFSTYCSLSARHIHLIDRCYYNSVFIFQWFTEWCFWLFYARRNAKTFAQATF